MTAWPTVPLAEVADVNPRLRTTLQPDDMVSFLGMADASEGGTTTSGEDRKYATVSKGFTPFELGDILVAKITPCFQNGKIVQARIRRSVGFGSTEFHVVRSKNDMLNHRFALHFLRQQYIRIDGERRMTGSGGQRRVPADFLKTLQVPFPSVSEQQRIAAILDHADVLRLKRRTALTQLDELTQSIFVEMFGDQSAYKVAPLSDLAEVSSGLTKGRKLRETATREVPYMAVLNVQDKALDLSTVKTIEATEAEINRYRLQYDDLLLTEGGDPDKLGRGTLWRGEIAEAIHQNHIFKVRIHSEEINPTYLNWAVGSRTGKAYFLKSAKQTTGIASINTTQLRGFPVRLPPIEQQKCFAERTFQVDKARKSHRAALLGLDSLFASIQTRAFRGEL